MLQPPTDNLYKFLAIFGLVLFGFSWFVPLQKLEDYSREVAKWHAAWKPILVRALDEEDKSKEELDCAIKRADNKGRKSSSKFCLEVESRQAQANKNFMDFQLAMAELQGGKDMLAHLWGQYVIYRNLGIIFGIVGLICCLTGFWLWYVRLQKPMDMALCNKPDEPDSTSAPEESSFDET